MLGAGIFMWMLALCGIALAARRPDKLTAGLRLAWGNVLFILPRVPLAILGAGFFATLLPGELVAGWLGDASGWRGILVASIVGSAIPSGPMVSFPIAVALVKAGAGLPQVIAFVTSWSVLALHRVVVWEVPLLGARFAGARLLASLILPPAAGALTAGLIYLL